MCLRTLIVIRFTTKEKARSQRFFRDESVFRKKKKRYREREDHKEAKNESSMHYLYTCDFFLFSCFLVIQIITMREEEEERDLP